MTAITGTKARKTTPAAEDTLDPEELMSRDELEALQLQRLQHTVAYAYERVAMYKKKFDDAGVRPEDLKELSDLAKFPYTDKEDLRQAYPFGMFAVPQQEVARIHASSGTTGRATVVGYTRKDLEIWETLFARSHPRLRREDGLESPQRLRLRPVHRRTRRPLRRGEARLHRDPDVRRPDREADPAHPGLRTGCHPVHARPTC